MPIRSRYILLAFIAVALLAASCKKTKTLTTGGHLRFSVDTLKFDTVFTETASFTSGLKIYNDQAEDIVVSSVMLQGGATSYFHLNVDGVDGTSASNIKIAAHDSVYVFATVHIDPNNVNTPFIVSDALVATLNGQSFSVPFTAYGQNAHYIRGEYVGGQIWVNDKPYVIIGGAAVDSNKTLTIAHGCRIYFNADASLLVFGTLNVQGTAADSVVFQGDRLDRAYFGYQGYPGEWGGIYFSSYSIGSVLSYLRIDNCGNGALGVGGAIHVAPDSVVDAVPQLTMDHVLIQNSISRGILSFAGSINAANCLVHTTGAEAIALIQGGKYNIDNCTFANYGSDKVSHSDKFTALILNYYIISQDLTIYGDLDAKFTNSIIYGSLDSEAYCDKAAQATAQVTFDHCLLKTGIVPSFVTQVSTILNQDPLFVNTQQLDFHLGANSPAIGAGAVTPAAMDADLEGNPRTAPYDLGCYLHHL